MKIYKNGNYLVQKFTRESFYIHVHSANLAKRPDMKLLDKSLVDFDEEGTAVLEGNEPKILEMLGYTKSTFQEAPEPIDTGLEMTPDGKVVVKGQPENNKKITRPEGEISTESMEDIMDKAADMPEVTVDSSKPLEEMTAAEINSLIKKEFGEATRFRSVIKAQAHYKELKGE